MNNDKVVIYTDGACFNNPGPGGYACILRSGNSTKEFSCGYRKTTNNRMELLAVITALSLLKKEPLDVMIYSDSEYVINAVKKQWLFSWEKKNFKKVKNVDLWKRFLELYKNHKIDFSWVEGHTGDPGNERCDYLAKIAAGNPTEIDTEYEKLNYSSNSQTHLF